MVHIGAPEHFSDNMEEYLISVNNTVEFTEILEKVTDDCALEFDGSKVHKHIHILVNFNAQTEFGSHFILKMLFCRDLLVTILMERVLP